MRKNLTTCCLIISVLLWGIWFGGQLFNAALVIPKWLSAPPESIKAYNALPVSGGFPFFLINPFFTLFSLLALVSGWKLARRARPWMVVTTLIGLAVSLVLIFYLAPLIHSVNDQAVHGNLPGEQIISAAKEWKSGNRIRLGAEFCGFLFSIIALFIWAQDTVYHKPNNKAAAFR